MTTPLDNSPLTGPKNSRRLLPVVLLGASSLLAASPAHAAASEIDRSMAQSLFEQAKQLMASGNYDEACPKLEESQRLDPGGGTLINLALCHEKQGKVATAWAEFKEALSAAKRDGRSARISAAQEHIAALEPKLPWLTLNVPSSVDGEQVRLDGAVLGRAAWGTAVAIDPGTHEVVAAAPGKREWHDQFSIALAQHKTFAVPALEDAPGLPGAALAGKQAQPAIAPSQAPLNEAAPGSGRKALGWALIGTGAVGVGVGSYFGIRTFNKRKASTAECPTDDTCSPEGVNLNNQAYTSAWISNIGFGIGIAGLGVGTYLLLTGHGAEPQRAGRLTFDASPLNEGGQVHVRGSF